MKKFLILIMLILVAPITVFAKTQAELDEEIKILENQNNQKIAEIEKNNNDALTLEKEILQMQEEILNTQGAISDTSTKIKSAEEQIKILEKDIKDTKIEIEKLILESEKLKKDSSTSLQGLQRLEHQNVVFDIIFNESNNIANVLTQLRALGTITDALINDLIRLNQVLVEIENKKIELETKLVSVETEKLNLVEQNNQLVFHEKSLSSQMLVSKEYQKNLNLLTKKAENALATNEAKIAVATENRKFLEDAGCGPNDVYGVDCAVPPPSSGGGNSGGGIIEASDFRSPLKSGRVTDEFGGRGALGAPFHTGIDLGKSCGAPLYASAPGVVTFAGWKDAYGGNVVIILHLMNGKNYVSSYNHLQSVNVSTGQNVDYSTQVGQMGTTGSSTGCHLHFELNTGSLYGWDTGGNTFFDPRNMIYWPPTWVEF